MNATPRWLDSVTNLPALARQIDLPGVSSNTQETLMCFTGSDGSKKCFSYDGRNKVSCKGNECFVSYGTMNQQVIARGKQVKKLGLDILMLPDGLSTSFLIAGRIPRDKLRTLKKIVGNKIMVNEIADMPSFQEGISDPPSRCHLNPFSKGCSIYLSSDDWVYVPAVGFKRNADMIKNPKSILKNEFIVELKKKIGEVKTFLTSIKDARQSNQVADSIITK